MKRLRNCKIGSNLLVKEVHLAEPPILVPQKTDVLPPSNGRQGNATARRAAQILVEKNQGFSIPTPQQKKNLVIAFVKSDRIVYGRAFDIVKLLKPVNLDELAEVEASLENIQLFEIKSTNKQNIGPVLINIFLD
jgi:hypothetical protein